MADRVLFVGNSVRAFVPHRQELLRAIQLLGHDTRVACPPFEYADYPDIAAIHEPLSLSPHSVSGFDLVRTFRSLTAILHSYRPTIVICCTIKAVLVGSLAARAFGVPKVFSLITGLGYVFMGETLRARIVRAGIAPLYRRALSHNDRVFFQNRDNRELFIRKGFVLPSKASVIPGSGVDTERFAPRSGYPSRPTFLTITRLIRDKGVHDLIQAATIVKARSNTARFVLLGERSTHPSSLSDHELRNIRSTKLFEMPEPMHDVRPLIDDSSVFVLPSYREGLPRAGLEAMAMARPVVVTDVPGCRDLVRDYGSGVLAPPRNPTTLAGAIEQFIENPNLIPQMGLAARRAACEHFDVHLVNSKIIRETGLTQ